MSQFNQKRPAFQKAISDYRRILQCALLEHLMLEFYSSRTPNVSNGRVIRRITNYQVNSKVEKANLFSKLMCVESSKEGQG